MNLIADNFPTMSSFSVSAFFPFTSAASRRLAAGFAALSLVTVGFAQTWSGTPTVQPILPADVKPPVSQFTFNNLAWQQFIALNWAADPNNPGQPDLSKTPAQFGTQLDSTPTVWESFKEASEVFQPNAAPPTPWNATRKLPAKFPLAANAAAPKATSKFGVKGLFATSKFTGVGVQQLTSGEIFEADGNTLTAQNGYLTLFEKRLNQDEFNYIVQNQLYNATTQAAFAQTTGINLPDGTQAFITYGTVGAIEIKAAWIELDDPKLWPLFKIAQAYVSYPTNAKQPATPNPVTVGLVGLHIIHKTANAQQFVWSTFEHVNNAPSVADIQAKTLKAWYTYYNATGPTTYNTPPTDYTTPVQVVRTIPISSSTANNIAGLNQNVWSTIAAANPNSVFLNYQLVNVLWPTNNSATGGPGATVPLTAGNPNPPVTQQPVASTVLETYKQALTCLTCHVGAPVSGSATLASDYSFLFSEAQTPSGGSASKAGNAGATKK